jgi:hypothetical protein
LIVVVKNPADFIGECLGKSEAKTKKILEATVGKVLVIDEAYMLDPGDPNKEQDKFKTGVIDTLVSIVQGVSGEDRCIILVGYEDRISRMFHNVNPGLSRRFPIDTPICFSNFNLPQLKQILQMKIREQGLTSSPQALEVAYDVLERALMRPHFTNAGEVESCLRKAKMNYGTRLENTPLELQGIDDSLKPEDFDADFDRATRGSLDIHTLLAGQVQESVIETFKSYRDRSLGARRYGLNPRDQVPTTFIFTGPPGKCFFMSSGVSRLEVMGQTLISILFLNQERARPLRHGAWASYSITLASCPLPRSWSALRRTLSDSMLVILPQRRRRNSKWL